jgi:glycosyltransferase involved in cell wall biosynthesis
MKIAFVPAWFGPDIPGGSEQVCRELAARSAAAGDYVEVLTTCIRDFHADWGLNHHPPGLTREMDLPVRRFSVKPRSRRMAKSFDRINGKLMAGDRSLPQDEQRDYLDKMFQCPTLFEHLRGHSEEFDAFVLNPYMFASTFFGVEAVGGRAALLPALHDEAYAYLPIYREMFETAGVVLSQTSEEADLIERIYGPEAREKTRLIGMGVDTEWTGDGERFRRKHNLNGLIFLYAGRRERQKGVYDLLAAFNLYRRQGGAGKLVLIGSGEMSDAPDAGVDVLDLGFVDRQEKYDALTAADIFCLPSEHESFSIALMEAFLAETPALVNGECAVTRGHCTRSQAGLYADSIREMTAALEWLANHPSHRSAMGNNGRRYVLEYYHWDRVMEGFRAALETCRGAAKC